VTARTAAPGTSARPPEVTPQLARMGINSGKDGVDRLRCQRTAGARCAAAGENAAPQRKKRGAVLTAPPPVGARRGADSARKKWLEGWGHASGPRPSLPATMAAILVGHFCLAESNPICSGGVAVKPYGPSLFSPWPPAFSPSATVAGSLGGERWRGLGRLRTVPHVSSDRVGDQDCRMRPVYVHL